MSTVRSQSTPANPSKGAAAKPKSLKSMTGYAQARAVENGWTLRVSVRSVNHRFLDLHLRVPDGFEALEPRIRQIIRERIRRGHLDVTLRYDLAGPAAVGVNEEVAAAYLQAVHALQKQFGFHTEPDMASILRLPGVIGPPAASLDEELTRLESVAVPCLMEALDQLDRMREQEGEALCQDMSRRLSHIADLAAQVVPLAERARPAFARRLELRLKDLLGEAQLDPARLAQEAALAAERSDVSEELARLASHVRQFESLLSGAADAGKKLDFLLQEMQREANTLLSKTPGTEDEGMEITRLGIEIKSEIEKLREQVQNIE
ncbi:MAG TPA: YicC/YloC family endoribonuclease [Candidatus Polarisedimenticolia bacterium]|nr:YicC/YloC family endoribonuclease [Candidatus Polarisedimenticolia bacterium]